MCSFYGDDSRRSTCRTSSGCTRGSGALRDCRRSHRSRRRHWRWVRARSRQPAALRLAARCRLLPARGLQAKSHQPLRPAAHCSPQAYGAVFRPQAVGHSWQLPARGVRGVSVFGSVHTRVDTRRRNLRHREHGETMPAFYARISLPRFTTALSAMRGNSRRYGRKGKLPSPGVALLQAHTCHGSPPRSGCRRFCGSSSRSSGLTSDTKPTSDVEGPAPWTARASGLRGPLQREIERRKRCGKRGQRAVSHVCQRGPRQQLRGDRS